MRVHVASQLPCSPEQAWEEVQKSSLLREVAWPVVTFRAVDGEAFPERWQPETTVRCRTYLFALLPFGVRTLFWERIDARAREMQTREWDALIRRWDHLISVQPTADGQTLYSDRIDIDAGWLTLPVAWFARCFYRHRQRRWQRVARRLSEGAGRECPA